MAAYDDDPDNDFLPTGNRRCHAARRNGLRCGQPAMSEQNICRLHGGSIGRNLETAEKKRLEAEARKTLAKLMPEWEHDPEAIGNPVQAMAALAGRNQHLLDHVWAALEPKAEDCLCCGALLGLDGAMLSLYTQAEKALRGSLSEMSRMKLNERLIDLEEVRTTMYAMALVAAIEEVLPDLNYVQQSDIKSAFLRRLTVLSRNTPEPQVVRML